MTRGETRVVIDGHHLPSLPSTSYIYFFLQTEICFCNELLKTDRRQEEVKFPDFLPDICERERERVRIAKLILTMTVVEFLSVSL